MFERKGPDAVTAPEPCIRAVLTAMGWEDDRRAPATEYRGVCWDLADEVATAVLEAAPANPTTEETSKP